MKKNIIILLAILGIIGIVSGAWFYKNFKAYAPTTYVTDTETGTLTTDTTTGTKSSSTPTYSMPDVATHKNASSCYTVISGSVYDVTLWVNLHPGGKDKILSICGIDGTQKFMNKHKGGEKFMTILARYKIGVVQ